MKVLRKLLLGVMTLILTVVALTTSTYAWFKINSNANVSGFDFRATSGEGFLVSIDGANYSNDITSSDMKKAILAGYDRDRFVFDTNNKDKGLYEVIGTQKTLLTDNEIDSYLNRYIKLYPATSTDGINFYTITGSKISSTKGMIVEFDVYFRAASQSNDGTRSSIYLLGENLTRDVDNKAIRKTLIKSTDVNNITLLADMKTINGDLHAAGGGLSADNVEVYTSNALRFSISDDLDTSKSSNTAYLEATTNENKNVITVKGPKDSITLSLTFDATGTIIESAVDTVDPNNIAIVSSDGLGITVINAKTGGRIILSGIQVASSQVDLANIKIVKDAIYEISDDSDYDLGSYATDYKSAEYIASITSPNPTLTDLDKLYNSDVNAMYTYYNNRRPYDQLTDRLLKYSEKPVTIRNLVTKSDIASGSVPHYIASVDSGSEAIKLTFRFWLEGWDADCFDGISKSITANLSFTSVKERVA